jgi:hypothetical protein
VGTIFSTRVQNVSEAHPASYTMGIGSLPGVKRPGCGVDHSAQSSAEVKERVALYLYSPLWAFVACSRVNFTLLYSYCETVRHRGSLLEWSDCLIAMSILRVAQSCAHAVDGFAPFSIVHDSPLHL